MKSCGVIVEYNPFHLGHKYHLEKAREVSHADVIVAVMSGNFLQRGEPAIIDKWKRANEALFNGADIVIELPFSYAVQAADYFSRGGIKLLQSLEVDALCFGTDSKENLDYEAFGEFHQLHVEQIDEAFQKIKNNGQSYPQQMTEVYRKLLPEWQLDFSSPNHILGMGYAKENASYDKPMILYPIRREGNHYHDEELTSNLFASATSIREKALHGPIEETRRYLPKETFKDLKESDLIDWNKMWPLLKYQLTVSSEDELAKIYQMSEGLEYRFKEAARLSENFEQFLTHVKSKRYTWARIQRLSLYVLLHITKSQMEASWLKPYIRVLGFNDNGRQFLKDRKKKENLPIITNINQKNEQLLSLDIKAGSIYSLLGDTHASQDYYKKPIYIKSNKKKW